MSGRWPMTTLWPLAAATCATFGAIPGGGGGIRACEVELKRAPASKPP